MSVNFDPVAKPYRTLERLTLGRALERTREHYLPRLTHARKVLAVGDGDGRFLAKLLRQNSQLEADAVDTSAKMLAQLRFRCRSDENRLHLFRQDALTFQPKTQYDLIATHFFLDCLTQPQVEQLTATLVPSLNEGGLWLVSDFRIPPAGPMRWPARLLVRGLYLAFRILTGLRVTQLPAHERALASAGLTRVAQRLFLGGLLTTELWQRSCQRCPSS
ncbi:Methyltransferase domain-containing protein [Granulicella rosea]|uniref:Methyltransferase domain-containing protein n=1 Tax=Granulicella rosea TaxID=474952 RepID=A0A239L2Y8_9BACT|nr:class I SAM-dependent methyltransferase [Granulicella rosea]SNT24352.1 Methyltransferase domain-containing protein [Granulicella rosea]